MAWSQSETRSKQRIKDFAKQDKSVILDSTLCKHKDRKNIIKKYVDLFDEIILLIS